MCRHVTSCDTRIYTQYDTLPMMIAFVAVILESMCTQSRTHLATQICTGNERQRSHKQFTHHALTELPTHLFKLVNLPYKKVTIATSHLGVCYVEHLL